MFSDEGAVVVASTYTKVGGLYDRGFRHDPKDPLGTLAEYCMGCYTNLSLPERVKFIAKYAPGRPLRSIQPVHHHTGSRIAWLDVPDLA